MSVPKLLEYTSEKPQQPQQPQPIPYHEHSMRVEEVEEVEVSRSIHLSDLTSVYWKDEPLTEKQCGVCGYVKPTVWEAVTVKGQVIPLCEECVQAYQKERA